MAAGADMFSHQPGRAALSDLMVLYARHEHTAGELPPVLFDHLVRLLEKAGDEVLTPSSSSQP